MIIFVSVVAAAIVTAVLLVDKLLNKPGVDAVPGIIQFDPVPCIVTFALIAANADAPTEESVVASVYPRLIVARLEQL